jgi:2-C-methyl-D-erythritol 4-phosphate cytidylyltransferase
LATIPVLPIVDTVKPVTGEQVLETVDRQTLAHFANPSKGFKLLSLLEAYKNATEDFTDDAALVQLPLVPRCAFVTGDAMAFKVITPDDIVAAELHLSNGKRQSPHRHRSRRSPIHRRSESRSLGCQALARRMWSMVTATAMP